jgi:hypothetical protein
MVQGQSLVEDWGSPFIWGKWTVQEHYAIREGMLIGQGETKQTYEPMRHPELVTELAKLHVGDEKAVLRFARHYGKLGYDSGNLMGTGESLAWIWAHAMLVRICLTLTQLLVDGSPDEVEDYVAWAYWETAVASSQEAEPSAKILHHEFTSQQAILAHNQRIYDAGGLGLFQPRGTAGEVLYTPHRVSLEAYPPHSPRNLARRMRSEIINQHMGRIARVLRDTDEASAWSSYALQAPFNYVYWHLADLVEDRHAQLRRCAACSAWFVQQDTRQRFCPPGPGQIGSRCAARERMRAKRRRAT